MSNVSLSKSIFMSVPSGWYSSSFTIKQLILSLAVNEKSVSARLIRSVMYSDYKRFLSWK